MKKRFLFAYLTLFFSNVCLSSGGIASIIEELQQKELIIIIESPVKDVIKKLDESEQQAYSKAIGNYNKKLIELAPVYWKLNSKILFKTWEEVRQILKNKSSDYLVLYAGNYSTNVAFNSSLIQYGLKFYGNIFKDGTVRDYDGYYTQFNLSRISDIEKPLVTRTISSLWPLKEDIIFTLQYISSYLNDCKTYDQTRSIKVIASENCQLLKHDTLLVKDEIADDGITKKSVEKVYPYPFEIVSHDSILTRLGNCLKCVYVEVVPQMENTYEAIRLGYAQYLIETGSGKIVGHIPVNIGILHASSGQKKYNKFVSLRLLEDYAFMYDKKNADRDFKKEPRE